MQCETCLSTSRYEGQCWTVEVMVTNYSKTPIYRAPIYRVPRSTGPHFYPPKTSFVCKSLWNVPRYTVLLDLPGLIPFPQEAR